MDLISTPIFSWIVGEDPSSRKSREGRRLARLEEMSSVVAASTMTRECHQLRVFWSLL